MTKLKKAKILLVEDEPADQALFLAMARMKEWWVKNVRIAENGTQALEMLANSEQTGWLPDLILVDLHMPEMSGIELIKSLRSQSIYDNIPVLVLTSLNTDQNEFESFLSRADGFLEKPDGLDAQEALFSCLLDVWKKVLK